MAKILEETEGDENKAKAMVRKKMLEDLSIDKGRIAVYGKTELSSQLGVFSELQDILPEVHFIGEGFKSILMEARATKDEDEIQRIRKMGEITIEVVGRTASYLQGCQIRNDEVLLKEDGKPVTVAEVKSKINYFSDVISIEDSLWTGCRNMPENLALLYDDELEGENIEFFSYKNKIPNRKIKVDNKDKPFEVKAVGGWYLFIMKGYAGISVIIEYIIFFDIFLRQMFNLMFHDVVIALVIFIPFPITLTFVFIPAIIILDIIKEHRKKYIRKWAKRLGITDIFEVTVEKVSR